MRLGLTITQRYLLFTAAVIMLFIVSTQVITSRVVRTGLEEVFRQRFDRAQVVVDQYETVHRLAKTTELESVLNSPRFIAAVETEDSATISAELPIYQRVLGADLVVLTNRNGELLFASDSLEPESLNRVQAYMRTSGSGVANQYVQNKTGISELYFSPIANSSGNIIGSIAEGTRLSAGLPDDLKQLTGFDVMISYHGNLIGATKSPLIDSLRSRPERLAGLFAEETRMGEISGETDDLIYTTLKNNQSPALITFVTSLNEHIAPIRKQITLYLILLAVIGGLVSTAVIWWFVSRRIGRQVTSLVAAAEAVAAGNLDMKVEALDNDELGYLAGEFDKMRNRLIRSRREIEEAHAGALASERLAAVGKLATGIIHDFKNPMAVIRGTVDLIRARDKENEKLIRYCATIHDQVDRMVDLTRDVLDYSRGESRLDLVEIDLAHYFHTVKEFHQSPFDGAGIDLSLSGDNRSLVRLDQHRFRRVIDNILNNAREALKPGNRVILSWSVSPQSIVIEITDNGPGIPENIRATLFEPFVTSNKEGGTGLGLAIAKKVIEDHGGSIAAHSQTGVGTRFIIELPASLAVVTPPQPHTVSL